MPSTCVFSHEKSFPVWLLYLNRSLLLLTTTVIVDLMILKNLKFSYCSPHREVNNSRMNSSRATEPQDSVERSAFHEVFVPLKRPLFPKVLLFKMSNLWYFLYFIIGIIFTKVVFLCNFHKHLIWRPSIF